jgi:acetyltransferase
VIRNLQANGYEGEIHLVNPKGGRILGLPVYTTISRLPDRIDHAVVIVSAKDTPQALRAGAERGIRHFVLSAGGFSEVDEEGQRLQRELEALVREFGLRILGPNTSGHISMPAKYTSSFFPLGKLRRGRVSFIAQTGNFATHTMKQILTTEHFGVSRVIGLGNKIDIDETHALEYLAGDDETDAVIMYLESIMRPRRFLEVARQVTRVKPVMSSNSKIGFMRKPRRRRC